MSARPLTPTPPRPAGVGLVRRADHGRTSRIVLTGLWADAILVMAASAWNGGQAFVALGQHVAEGLALGLAVDVALAVALIGDRALHLAGRSSAWGRALRVITAVMSLALNCGVQLWQQHYGVAAFHAFLPVLLVLLSEYAQDTTLQFGEIATEHAAAVEAQRQARLAADRAAWEADQARREAAASFPTVGDHRTAPPPIPPAVAPKFQAVPSWTTTTGHRRPDPAPAAQHAEQHAGRHDPQHAGRHGHQHDSPHAGQHGTSRRPARAGRSGPSRSARRRTGTPLPDDQLAEAIREMTQRNGGTPPTAYQLRQAHGVRGPRAARLLAELDTTPAADPAATGAATREDES